MSGLRKCADCDRFFKIEDDGPEAMRGDGTFPRHACKRCVHLRGVLHALSLWPDTETQFVRTGGGPEAKLIFPRGDTQEALVLSVRYKGEKLAADVCEEDSGKIVGAEILFDPDNLDALEPLLGHLMPD